MTLLLPLFRYKTIKKSIIVKKHKQSYNLKKSSNIECIQNENV